MNKPLFYYPSLQILCAIVVGALLGCVSPALAEQLRPLGTLFVEAIRLLVGPVIFCTVAAGIASLRDLRQLGRLGLRLLVCFEVCTLLALATGLAGAWLLQPGVGMHLAGHAGAAAAAAIPATIPAATQAATQAAAAASTAIAAAADSLPAALRAGVVQNSVMQLLLATVACGILLAWAGERGARVGRALEWGGRWLFAAVNLVLKTAPLAALGAVAYAVGHYGLLSMTPLLKLVAAVYLSTTLFIVLVLGALARCCGFSLWRYLLWIGDELILVLGTASSMAAMPRLIAKLELAGCAPAVARVAVPASYSFNLNGSSVYLTLALVFLAQAGQVELGLAQYAAMLAVAMVTSKASSGIAGSAFVTLGATLAAFPAIPAESLVLLVSIERLLKCRPIANLIGNGVACLAVAAWMGELDPARLRASIALNATARSAPHSRTAR